MPNPTKYIPGYSFSGFQAVNPAKPLPAPRLDDELANIAVALGATIDGLLDFRRSDGKLKNDIVAFEALAPAVRAAIATGGGAGGSGALLIEDIDGLPAALDAKAARTAVLALDDALDDLTSSTAAALGEKVPLVSPQFTGIPTAVTRAIGDRSDALATTAFVGTELEGKADLVDGKVPVDQLPNSARVLSFSPFDYGGVGDGVADDTAAVNACFTALRAASAGSQGPVQGYITQQRLTVDLRGGMWRITGDGINATNIQAWNLEITGGLLVGETAGKPIMDLVGSRGYSMNGTGFFGVKDPAKRPSKAFVVARNNTGAQACDNTSFIEVSTTGWYSEAAIHVYGHETALHLHGTYFNYNHDAYVAIFEGFNAHPISSAFSGIQTGPVSFINNKIDICDFRYVPTDENIRSVANITIGANPTVTTSTPHAFANGDKVVFAYVGGQNALQREVATVANVTSTTFTAQGVTTTGSFTGGGNVIRAQTKPSVYLARAQDFNFDSSYIVAFGQPHLEIGFPDTSFLHMDDIQLDLLFEGSGQDHNVAVTTGGQYVSLQGFEFKTYNSAARVSLIGISGGQLNVVDAKLASHNQQGPALLVAPAANFAGYGCELTVPFAAYAPVTTYAAFTGEVLTVSNGSITEYGKTGPSGTWTPVLTSSGGALGAYSGSGTWEISGGLVYVTMNILISSTGSGSGTLQCTNLPFARVSESSNWSGRIASGAGVNGYMIQAFGGVANPKLLNIARYDGVYVGVGGYDMRLSGVYQII